MSAADGKLLRAEGAVYVAPADAPSPAPRHLLNERFVALDARYDAAADRTRVGFAIDTPELRAMTGITR